MKILFISSKNPFPPTDGGRISVLGILKHFKQRGYEVDFVCYRKKGDITQFEEKLNEFCNSYFIDANLENNLSGVIKNLFSSVPYNISKYYNVELINFLEKYLTENKVDIIQVTTLHMSWIVDYLRKKTNAPIILRQENYETRIMHRYFKMQNNLLLKLFSYIQYIKFINYEPKQCLKFDNCVMISEEDQNDLKRLNPNIKTSVIPVGVESNLLKYNCIKKEEFSIAHIGNVEWFPNYDSLKWLIEDIFPKVKRKYPQSKLYVYSSKIPSAINVSEEIKNSIIEVGYVDDLWGNLIEKKVSIVPLRIGSGIRVKILEMLAVGQTVITTSIGKEGINVNNEENIIIADTTNEIVCKISAVFEGQFNIQQMSINGKNLINQYYIWEKVISKFEQLYIGLLKK